MAHTLHLTGRTLIAWAAIAFLLAGSAVAQSADAPSQSRSQVLADARERASAVVLEASRSADAARRAEAIEAAHPDRDRIVALAQLGLADADPRVRYRALMAIGELKLTGLGRSATGLLNDPSPSVRAAAIYAAARTGQPVDKSPLAGLLHEPLTTARMNTAEVLARLGDRSARPMIQASAGVQLRRAAPEAERVVQIKLAEALVRLGDETAIDVIRAAAYEQAVEAIEVRVFAIDLLGRLGDRAMRPALSRLVDDDTREVRLAAATTLLRMDDPSGVDELRVAAGYTPDRAADELREATRQAAVRSALTAEMQAVLNDPGRLAEAADAVRAQAAYGLGLAEDAASARVLVDLLDDPSLQVRLSAAGAVLQAAGR
ncbi:MAG: HEAT repeat domain-containing protein [Planctomycetota bacterium]